MTAYVSAHMVNVPAKKVQGGKVARAHDARKGLLHEGARSLNDAHEQKWAADNPNIRPDFAQQNVVMVQRLDANGDWALSEVDTSGEERSFIEYGDQRVARLDRKVREGQVEVSSMVFHYPKEFCIEHPNESQAVDEKTGELVFDKFGEPVMVSRFTPRDNATMRAYFQDCLDHLAKKLGSEENIHGAFIHLDERTPHMQVVFDSYRVSQKDPDKLMQYHSRIWGSHRDVVYPDGTFVGDKDMSGKIVSGSEKMRKFHKEFRDYMADLTWNVSREHSENHDVHLTKDEYIAVANQRAANEQEINTLQQRKEATDALERTLDEGTEILMGQYRSNQKRAEELDKQKAKQDNREESLNNRENEWHRQKVAQDAREVALNRLQGKLEDEKEKRAEFKQQALEEAQQIRDAAHQDAQKIRDAVRDAAERDAQEKAEARVQEKAQQIQAAAQHDAQLVRTEAEQYALQTRTEADNYYNSSLSMAREKLDTLDGEISRSAEYKSTLEEEKKTLTQDIRDLRQKKKDKEQEVSDMVANPDPLPGFLKTIKSFVGRYQTDLKLKGVPPAQINEFLAAVGGAQADPRMERLARENEAKQRSQNPSQGFNFG